MSNNVIQLFNATQLPGNAARLTMAMNDPAIIHGHDSMTTIEWAWENNQLVLVLVGMGIPKSRHDIEPGTEVRLTLADKVFIIRVVWASVDSVCIDVAKDAASDLKVILATA